MARRTKKEILLDKKREDLESNNNNNFGIFDSKIKNWIIDSLENFSVEKIKSFDAFKAYQQVEIEEDIDNWVSNHGAAMTTTKNKVTFEFNDKTFNQNFIVTRGNW